MSTTRRQFIESAGSLALTAGFVGGLTRPAMAQSVKTEELMQPGALPDQILGAPDAPITIIEYASLTCSHCANFHATTYPVLKERYIDTGKVRFIFREFPLDPLAAGAFMLARCAGEGKYFPLVEALFQQQKDWVVQRPLDPLKQIAKQAGFTEQSFTTCLSNQKLLKDVENGRERAAKRLGVNSTPTFFINGAVHRGSLSIEELERLIQPHLKS